MSDQITDLLERATPTDIDRLDYDRLAARGRRRRWSKRAGGAAVAGLAVAAVATVLPSQPVQDAVILDQPDGQYQPWQGQPIDATILLCNGDRCPAITGDQLADLGARLQADPAVQALYFESQEDAHKRLVATLAPGAPEAAESLAPADLSSSFRINLTDRARFDIIEQRFASFPGVMNITDRNRVVPVTQPMPDAETVAAKIFMVEVTPDGQSLDLYRRACGRVFLVEFEETPTEIRARFVRTTDQDPAGCAGSHRVDLEEPLGGRPIIDLSTGDAVTNVRELRGPTP